MQYPGLKIERLCVGLPRPECRAMPPMGAADCRLARGHYCAMGCHAAGCYAVMLGAWRAVRCVVLAVLSYGDALRWLCCAVGCARSRGYLSLLLVCLFCLLAVVLCGGGGAAWCCPVCRFAPLVLVYCLRLQLCASYSATVSPVLLRSLAAACHPVGFHPLPFRARLFRLRRARSAYLAIHITIVAFIII